MFNAFSKAVFQLNDPRTRKMLWLSIGAALSVFAVLWLAIFYLLTSTSFFAIAWLEWAVDLLGGLATLVLTWFLFPGVITVVIGLFLDDIAAAVEARHYPELPPAEGLSVPAALLTTLRYLGVMIVLNLGLLVFLFFPPLFPFVFYAVNGYLLSREYFELVASRRAGADEIRELRKAHRGKLFVAGVIVAVLLTIPGVNLLAPVVATAAMVHLFESWRNEASPV